MSAAAVPDRIAIILADGPGVDAFGLDVDLDGSAALLTIESPGPGIFRTDARAEIQSFVREGWIIGFLQRGPLLTPVTAPCAGWVLAAAPEGARVGHGAPLLRMLRAGESIVP